MIRNKKQQRDTYLDQLISWLELKQSRCVSLLQISYEDDASLLESRINEVQVRNNYYKLHLLIFILFRMNTIS